jgi:hypothetical protein
METLRCRLGRGYIAGAMLLLALSGLSCSQPNPGRPVFPVRGQVLLNGKPLPGVVVIFHPTEEWGPEEGRPRGETDAEGRFVVSTYGAGDGAPAGAYKVAVLELRADEGESATQADLIRPSTARRDRPPTVYTNPDTSGLRATVAPGPNELDPFRLKSGPGGPPKSNPFPEID